MKQGTSLSALASELERQAKSKRDYICDTRALHAKPDDTGTIMLEGVNGGMPLLPSAHSQMGETLGIAKNYYDKMLTNAPDLLATNINHWLKAEPKRRLVRTLDGGVRAFLSDRYRPLDNLDLAEAVIPKLINLEAEVVSSQITVDRMYIKATTPKITGEVKKGDIVQAGLVISNSEIGNGALSVQEMTYRLVCLNGAIHASIQRQTHAGRRSGYDSKALELEAQEFLRDETREADDKAFFMKVQDAVAMTLTAGRLDQTLNVYREAADRKIVADPIQVLEVTAKKFGLGETERGSIMRHLIEGGDLSQWGLGNAITRASQEVEEYGRATELEATGAMVFMMPEREWKTLAV